MAVAPPPTITSYPSWQAPDPLNFARAGEEWPKWIRRFERYRIVSGLSTKTEVEQVNALIYCMGDQADDVFISLQIPE